MTWTKYISKTYKVPYWHNSETNESVWEKPADFIEHKKEKKATATKPKNVVKTEEQKPRQARESSSNSVQISNSNGQSWTIEGQSHWTQEDYREELRNLNQSLRER
jgi:hypothetical protein